MSDLNGGASDSQISEDASVRVHNADAATVAKLHDNVAKLKNVKVAIKEQTDGLLVQVKGTSAHSSELASGETAIATFAEVFKGIDLEHTSDGQAFEFINQLIVLDLYGAQFGYIGYEHDFMGPMTVSPTVITRQGTDIKLSVHMRRPVGKEEARTKRQLN